MTLHQRQHGFSLRNLMLALIVLGPLILVGWQIGTIYLEYFQIRRMVESIGQDITSYDVEPQEIRRRFERTLSIEYISAITARDLTINKSRGIISVDLVYQDSRNLFGNFKIVGDFNETIQLYP